MPLSYGYYKAITEALTKRGDDVSFIPDFDESIAKRALRKLISIEAIQNKYIRNAIRNLIETHFDIIVIIRGYWYNSSTIEWMKNRYSHAKIIMYQWDPLSISKFDKNALGMCDMLFSFDKKDCNEYAMKYLPLFYKKLPPTNGTANKNEYDFSFVGSGHSQRLYVLGQLINCFKNRGYTYFVRVYINRIEYLRGIILNKPGYKDFPKEYLSFVSIPKSVANDVVRKTRVVVDVHHPMQSGLSIRVMEVLGAGKNIITTNKTILEEPFYRKEAIGIIEDCHLPSNIEELLSNECSVDVSLYEINNWINTLVPGTIKS